MEEAKQAGEERSGKRRYRMMEEKRRMVIGLAVFWSFSGHKSEGQMSRVCSLYSGRRVPTCP